MPHHIYSTHALHPKAEATLATAGAFQVASALDAATLAREGAQADIVIVRANIPAELFARLRSLRAAIRHGAGLDMISFTEVSFDPLRFKITLRAWSRSEIISTGLPAETTNNAPTPFSAIFSMAS